MEKPARHLLPRADFGERPVFLGVHVDMERLLMRVEFLDGVHEMSLAAGLGNR